MGGYIWSEENISILKDNYSSCTVKELQELFFNDLTLSQIKNKIYSLGITKTKSKCSWTDEERDILRDNYAILTNRELKERFFNDKTELQIKDCAATLGLKKNIRATRGWTDNCIEILNKYYNDLSAKEIHEKFLPQFSEKQIAEFASHCIGLHKDADVIARNRLKAQDEATLNSVPQQITDKLLDDLGIKYRREEIFSFYSVDNYLLEYNLAIEVQGDYWHVNPVKKYEHNKKRENYVKKDIRKAKFIHDRFGIDILYLWESDLKYNYEVCKQLILKYINSAGMLVNYHSFNYFLDDNLSLQLIENQYDIGY